MPGPVPPPCFVGRHTWLDVALAAHYAEHANAPA